MQTYSFLFLVLIGQSNGQIKIKTADPNNNTLASISNAHGCGFNNNCYVNHIQQLSSAHSSYVVTCGDDQLIKLWKLNSSDPVGGDFLIPQCTLSGHTGFVFETLEVTSVTDTLASASQDGSIILWSISQCKQMKIFTVGTIVYTLENYPGGTTIVSGDYQGRIIIWDVVKGTQTLFATLASALNDLQLFGSNNQFLGAATNNNCNGNCSTVTNYDQGSLWMFNVFNSGFDVNNAKTVTAAAKYIYFVYGDTFLLDSLNLDLTTGSIDAHTSDLTAINPIQEISDDFATTSLDGTAKTWSIANRKLLNTYRGHTGGIYGFALDHVAQPNKANKQIWLFVGSLDTNVNTYSIPHSVGNPLVGVYSSGEQVTSLCIVNKSSKRVKGSISSGASRSFFKPMQKLSVYIFYFICILIVIQ